MVERARRRHPLVALLGSLLILSGLIPAVAVPPVLAVTPVFINEIHYDNASTDVGEAIEIAGPAGTDLTGWSIVLYNGSTGETYDTDAFSGSIVDAGSGFGTASITYAVNGIQNGAPDGIALVNGGTVVQFLSYEGTFTAVGGPADGMLSTDIGVAEQGDEAIGLSIGLTGTGTTYEHFTWAIDLDDSFGDPNPGQTFGTPPPPSGVINEFLANHAGTDVVEYVEVFGQPNTDLSDLTVLEIEGDAGTSTGTIDQVVAIGTTDAGGFFLANLAGNDLENGTITLLLVRDFSGAAGGDIDADGDGAIDAMPWSEIVDAVAVNDGGAGDLTYGVPSLGVAYDGMAFAPGAASRIPDGADTDTAADWVRNDFDLAGIPGFDGTPVVGEAFNTPGAPNEAVPSEDQSLVINEIDYDQPSTDTAEFLELKNVGPVTVGLEAFSVEMVNGNGGGAVVYRTVALPVINLAAGDYFVLCANSVNTANCDLDVLPDTDLIQNGAPDAIGLRFGTELVDAVSYEGITGAPYTEGTVGAPADTAGVGESISRCPDGTDTDQNDVDFALRPSTPGAENDCGDDEIELGVCGDDATLIHDIQGNGLLSPLDGSQAVIEGIVVGDFQNNASADSGELNGYYVQEEDAEADGDAATSEGIFVFHSGGDDVAIGDLVRVVGTVDEFGSGGPVTELTSVGGLIVCSSGHALPALTQVTLPVTEISDLERYEGMRVNFPQALVIAEYFNYDRFGEVVLALPLEGEDRPFTGTAIDEPGAAANARTLANSLRRITLDDGLTSQNPEVTRHPNGDPFSLDNRFRGGDTVANAAGVIDHSFNLYRIHPTQDADYTPVNPRPLEPDDVGGTLKVAAMNTLNYFITADYPSGDPLDNACGPMETLECRGWDFDQPTEFTRQRDKLLQALGRLGADVIGLNEVENRPGVEPAADIAEGLTDLGFGPWAAIETGVIGTDAIKVGLVYRTDRVEPVGDFQLLTSDVDARFIDTRSRPVLAQTFDEIATGGRITVAVNHLKSKGSACTGEAAAPLPDPDLGDGQGNCPMTRTLAAQAMVDWLAGDPTGSGDRDYLIIGDLNSYAKEDPIDAILAGPDDTFGTNDDYTNLIQQYLGEHAYSFVFDGQFGYLDHALASSTLVGQVTGVTEWHINADEPDLLDYDTSFKSDGQDAIYAADQYRTSDHDPVIVGLDLQALDFDGFKPPVDSPPAVNTAKAGSTIPLRFSLGEDAGLDVLFETPQVYLCGDWPLGASDDAASVDGVGLTYDPAEDQYTFEWKTVRSWSHTCRTLEVTLTDGTFRLVHVDFAR